MSRLQAAVFFVIGLQVSACGLAAGEAEECWQPGAVRAEADGVSVCVAGEGWQRAEAEAEAAGRAAPACDKSDAGKYTCDTTCTTLGVCLSDGTWLATLTCPQDSSCFNGTCNEGEETCPTSDTIKCSDKGSYPNMKNCSSYFKCDVGHKLTDGECDPGTFFNACTGDCDVESSDPCPWEVSSPCEEEGSRGVAPNNDRLYYVCVRDTKGGMTQIWSKCLKGHYNTASLKCERNTELGCGPVSSNEQTTVSDHSIDATESTTTEQPVFTTSAPFACSSPGVYGDPYTDCIFHYCYLNGNHKTVSCADGYHFEKSEGECVKGKCT